jgi:ABC-type transport system involved in multi-copper enzyme maturation permease subunit
MPSTLLAELGRSRRRRAIWLISLITLAILGLYSWTNHKAVEDSRTQIDFLESSLRLEVENPGQRLGPTITQEEFRAQIRQQIASDRKQIEDRRIQLSSKRSHRYVLGYFGTAIGVSISILLAAVLSSGDFRWSYWKTLASHEPRRGRLILAKFISIWLFILIGLLVILALSYPLDALFARLYDVQPPRGIPAATDVAGRLWRAWLVNSVYASLAAAIVFASRSAIAGLAGGFGIFVAEGVASQRIATMHPVSIAQQVLGLFRPRTGLSSFADVTSVQWFEPTALRTIAKTPEGFPVLMSRAMKLVPTTRAALVLVGWILVFSAFAIAAMKRRDLPA